MITEEVLRKSIAKSTHLLKGHVLEKEGLENLIQNILKANETRKAWNKFSNKLMQMMGRMVSRRDITS